MKALYGAVTGDVGAHQARIAAAYRKLDPERRKLIRRRMEGAALREIASELGVSHGSVQGRIERALWAVHKLVHGLGRYHVVGRGAKLAA